MERVQMMPSRKFNNEQCEYLADKLKAVIQSASLFLEVSRATRSGSGLSGEMAKCVEIFKLLLGLARQIESFIQGCCKDAWIQAAMTLTNVSEYVSSLGFNLELCRVAFCKQCVATGRLIMDQVADINKDEVDVVEKKACADVDALFKKVLSELNSLSSEDKDLACYLLQKLQRVKPMSPSDLPESSSYFHVLTFSILKSNSWSYFGKLFKLVHQTGTLGRGGSSTVDKAMWLGIEVAKKTIYGRENPAFTREVEILEGLCHPNIMSMFCWAMDSRRCSIVMELMDGDLHALMQSRLDANSDSPPFTILEAVDIMLQVGEGVKYLHNKFILHRDLKSFNILVKCLKTTEAEIGYVHVKVADFGLSKTKECSTRYSNQTSNMGTHRWMAPEIIKIHIDGSQVHTTWNEKVPRYPFKGDVYSFGMVCLEILTGDVPFADVVIPNEVKKKVMNGERPKFPDHCPPKLKALILKCWNQDPAVRPSFTFICSELKRLKCSLMTGFCLNQDPHLTFEGQKDTLLQDSTFIEDTLLQASSKFESSVIIVQAKEPIERIQDNSEVVNVHSRDDALESNHKVCLSYNNIQNSSIVPPNIMWEDSRVQGKMRFCKAICEKIYSLQMSRNGVCVVGLYGMGGIGKTTICKALCNEMFMEFKGVVCHLQLGSGTKLELMQEVLKKLSNKSYDGLLAFNEDKCRHYLHRELKKQRIFLVIDNVSDSLMAMQQAKDFLNIEHSSGSIVLVAARSLVQLINLHMDESTCFEMPNMFEEEARSLFLYHAAPQIEVDEELLRQCIKRCYFMKGNGRIGFYHPLALKVLGLQFRMTNPKEWPQQLDAMLKEEFNQLRNNEHPIFSIFRKSYDTLEHEDQVLFMDAALYCPERLIGSNWWSNMFEWLGMVHNISVPVVIRRLKVLKMKCLIEDVGDGSTRICVHDLWHQFCKAEPEFDRRFVYHNQEILKQHSLSDGGWEGLRRVCLRGNGLLSSTVKTVNLSHCRNLGVLKLVGVDIEDHLLDLRPLEKMKSLEILFGLFPFPKGSSVAVLGLGTQSNLSVLKWDNIPSQSPCIEEIGCLTNLQVLHLESGQNKNKMPNVGSLILLKEAKINFSDGADTIEGLSSKMGKLRYLDLGGCHGLRNCPGVADLVALEELDLCGCSMLRELPNLQKLTKLRKLDITGCQSIKALLGLGELVSLQELRAGRCWGLDEFPDLFMLTNLQVLDILYVYSEHVRGLDNLLALEELRVDAPRSEGWPDVSKFTRLETLVVNGWAPHRLPSATMITKLKRLTILHCSGLHELAGLWKMRGLKALSIRHCEFKDVSDLRHLTALQHLEIHDCGDLERLPDLHTLTRLELLDVMDCRSLRHWEGVSTALQYSFRAFEPDRVGPLSQLENLKLRGLPVAQIPDLSNFPRLKALDLVHCGGLKSLNSTGPLTALEDLRLYGCTSLQALPDLSCSTRLKSFILYNCGVQLTLKEIEKIKAMCPALMLDKSILSDMESEKIQY